VKRVLVLGKLHPSASRILEAQADLQIDVIVDPGAAIPVAMVEQSDALLIRYGVLTAAHIAHAHRLQVVSRHGVGCDNLPLDALSARGIPVTIVGAVTAGSVAEQTMAMLLALAKKIGPYDRAVRDGNWAIRDGLSISDLAGRTMLLLGFGRIGREVARRALAFDMQVLVFDPFVTHEQAAAASVVKVDDWRATLGQVDVLSVHLPLGPDTRNIVDAAVLAALKPTAIVLNAARGGLVDESALCEALAGRMAAGGAGIDTFVVEPALPDSPLLRLPNVVVSPHSAALTDEAAARMGVVAVKNVIAGLEGRLDPALVFNRKALEQRATR
jgi:D-3-phosphoglycerate dehydrogenase